MPPPPLPPLFRFFFFFLFFFFFSPLPLRHCLRHIAAADAAAAIDAAMPRHCRRAAAAALPRLPLFERYGFSPPLRQPRADDAVTLPYAMLRHAAVTPLRHVAAAAAI